MPNIEAEFEIVNLILVEYFILDLSLNTSYEMSVDDSEQTKVYLVIIVIAIRIKIFFFFDIPLFAMITYNEVGMCTIIPHVDALRDENFVVIRMTIDNWHIAPL